MTSLFNGEPACKETLECRYWDEENLVWSTEGCETKVYNGTDGGSFTGCECNHLSEFVSVTVPTNAFGNVKFGSLDVNDGNLTHVSGERGGMWLVVNKEKSHMPTTLATVYPAYTDKATAPTRWEVMNVTCTQGPEPPSGAVGFPDAGSSTVSRCHWLREHNATGGLETAMSFELTGSGLAEDRDKEAYVAALTIALIYSIPGNTERREEFTVPIYTQVTAVPVASRSVRGRLPAGARCDQENVTTNNSGTVLVELGREASVPFSLCDLEGYPTSQPESLGTSRLINSFLHRVGAPASPLRVVVPTVGFIGGAYVVEVVPPALGSWELSVYLAAEQVATAVNITTYCPAGQVPMVDGDSCGCAAGTILKPGAGELLAVGEWPLGEDLCEPCHGVSWSEAGARACDHCAAGYYYAGPSINGSSSCVACPSFAVCQAFTALETLQLKNNTWRLSNKTLDARECIIVGNGANSPCNGGSRSGAAGSGYCLPGHEGPLCMACTEKDHFYVKHRQRCEHCGTDLFWLETLFEYVLPLLLIGLLFITGRAMMRWRPRRLEWLWRSLLKFQLLARDVSLYTRLKLLVGFYQVCGALPKVYDVSLPEEYHRYLGWLTWMGDISLDRILPVGCDQPMEPYQRLMVEGMVPLVLALLGSFGIVCVGVSKYLQRRLVKSARTRKQVGLGTVLLEQWYQVLPSLLPFTYLCSTSIATQAFSAFDCDSYEVDSNTRERVSYLASDLRVICDAEASSDYRAVRNTALALIAGVSALPVIYFLLLLRCRKAIITHSPTKLSSSIRFLWAEYHKSYWFFEPLQQLRKLFLTGYVMAIFPEDTLPNMRLTAATMLTLSFIIVSIYTNPFRDIIDGRIYSMTQVILLVLFQTGTLLRLCRNEELCRTFGFKSPFDVSIMCGTWTAAVVIVIASIIIIKAWTKSKGTALRLRNGKAPTVTLDPEHEYHAFVSHVWSTGQDQAAVIKRQLVHLMPSAKVFLDGRLHTWLEPWTSE